MQNAHYSISLSKLRNVLRKTNVQQCTVCFIYTSCITNAQQRYVPGQNISGDSSLNFFNAKQRFSWKFKFLDISFQALKCSARVGHHSRWPEVNYQTNEDKKWCSFCLSFSSSTCRKPKCTNSPKPTHLCTTIMAWKQAHEDGMHLCRGISHLLFWAFFR